MLPRLLAISSGGAQGLVLYCNYARDPEGPFAPYDLRVVGRHQVEVRIPPRLCFPSLFTNQPQLRAALLLPSRSTSPSLMAV